MKPWRIFNFFVAVMLLMLLLAWLMPEEGVPVSGDIRLRFISLENSAGKDSLATRPDLEVLLANAGVGEDPEDNPAALFKGEADSSQTPQTAQAVPGLNADSLRATLQRIEFSSGAPQLLHPFFRQLAALSGEAGATTRILHYGDSQIENDRMTALIRYRLQKRFGGSGTGLVPAVPLYSGHLAYSQEISGEWLRYTFFGNRDTSIRHSSYGCMAAFTSVPASGEGSWPALGYRFNTGRRTGRVERVRVFLHSFVDSGTVAFSANGSPGDTLRALPAGYAVADFSTGDPISSVGIGMALPEGGRIYGISFESAGGIQVDNIAMRGSSGLVFSKLNLDQQKQMMASLDPGLLLLQFGGNAVPYIEPAFYERTFNRELRYIREICPGVPVIVIGPSDMSVRDRGQFVTSPNLEPVRDALRRATLANGFAFWDLYEAMGGHNAMPAFVAAEPPLASADYVHFTPLGANLMAEMFHRALILAYEDWQAERGAP